MERIVINGGRPLGGEIEVSGMKNAALPILFATILAEDTCIIENLPEISDVSDSLEILRCMGAEIKMLDRTTVRIDTTRVVCGSAPYDLARNMRGSYYVLGAELSRFGKARAAAPGGDDFGVRPIDQHIKGFEAMGA
ncbi:MAG: UDP-N-acetylglucosamine 1-carboxyvinyltransferase, partial [Clostridia bacterium]|nr:UDP-N-acetylglucosamine 1-carboxyvinyltransferase [Clostridia bacterium]